MTKYFKEFIKRWEENHPGQADGIMNSSTEFVSKLLDSFSYKGCLKALLLGQVQSGKTSQMLSAISLLADKGIKLFILLTSDMTNLQSQTFKRALRFLPSEFCKCNEADEVRFREENLRTPTLIVLKKNSKVLKSWKSILQSTDQSKYETMVILDDEADAASLNTKVNQKKISTINRLLSDISSIPPNSIYVQVTATPQAVLLQAKDSGWRPSVVHTFPPGPAYRGGAFFYGENSRCIRTVDEDESKALLGSDEIPLGLRQSLSTFLINSIYLVDIQKKPACNFLIHPGQKTDHHSKTEKKIARLLKEAQSGSELLRSDLYHAYEDIRQTCKKLPNFDYFWEALPKIIESIQVQVLNSITPEEVNYEKGINILIGGNATGRGITFDGLQVVYYCRESKVPQADTLWQHSRIFGYDRVTECCRLFLPPKLLQIFRRLNEANDALFAVLKGGAIDEISILQPEGVVSTRKSVINQKRFINIVGDTNYDIGSADHRNTASIDEIIGNTDQDREISLASVLQTLKLVNPEDRSDRRDLNLYLNCLEVLERAGETAVHIMVRTDRDITKGTGTLLSPNDRKKGSLITDKTVITFYRVNGLVENKWDGYPLWIPNIKFPKGRCFASIRHSDFV